MRTSTHLFKTMTFALFVFMSGCHNNSSGDHRPGTSGEPRVPLGSINSGGHSIAVLAGSTVTNTGPTMVTGDLDLSPGTSVTGFLTVDGGPGAVSGTIHQGGATAAQAQADLTVAFNDAAGRPAGATVAGNLGGQSLSPGVYKSTSSLEISSGDLTLDALGDASAVFIFQIASTLTVTSGRQVRNEGSRRLSWNLLALNSSYFTVPLCGSISKRRKEAGTWLRRVEAEE